MKVKQEDYEHIGDRFTTGFGYGCATSLFVAAVAGALWVLGWLA